MDKYEYNLKLDQLRNLAEAKDYETAAAIADTINWKKVRNSNTLLMVAEIYEQTEKLDACKNVLLQAYDHSSIGRGIVSRLVDIAIKAKNVEDAEDYYREFLEISPRDNQRYIFAYKISCLKDAPLTDRIAILEEFKETEYSEVWAYELAALYGQADMREKCVETCDELILWFGEGDYVEKALDLKRTFQPLTPSQEEKYKRIRSRKGMVDARVPKQVEATISEESGLPEITVTASRFNTQNLQDEIAKGMEQIMAATEKETVKDTMENIKKIVHDIPYLSVDAEEDAPVFDRESINERVDEGLKSDFKELLDEDPDGQMSLQIPENTAREQQIAGQMSIEDVLAEWEKTKHAAEAAIAAAEQKKLDIAKEQALSEANEIMERLHTLLPVLSAEPGEDIPESLQTVAETLLPDEDNEPDSAESADSGSDARGAGFAEAADGQLPDEAAADEGKAGFPDDDESSGKEPGSEVPTGSTKEMPDVRACADRPAEEPKAPSGEAEKRFETPSEDEELEKILASATRMMMENASLEVPVSGGLPADELPSAKQEKLPDLIMPEELAEEEPVVSGEDGRNAPPQEEGILSEENRELFSYFLPVPGMREQIEQVLEEAARYRNTSITSLRGNLIIEGEEGSGKTVLATSLIKVIQKITGSPDTKIGRISAASLNQRDFAALVPKLSGGYLIVDKAGELTRETAVRMSQIMERNTQGMVVILEDDSAGIRQALALDFSFANKFTARIRIPIFTIDELVDFGKSYAKEMECVIDEMGVLALYNRINNIQKLDHPTTLAEIKDIVDQAIESAESGGLKKLFAKKYDENDCLILREKDFE